MRNESSRISRTSTLMSLNSYDLLQRSRRDAEKTRKKVLSFTLRILRSLRQKLLSRYSIAFSRSSEASENRGERKQVCPPSATTTTLQCVILRDINCASRNDGKRRSRPEATIVTGICKNGNCSRTSCCWISFRR